MNFTNKLLFLLTVVALFSCGQRAEPIKQTATFSLEFDTSMITSASTSDTSDRPTDPLYVSGKGRLEFFGVVVRKIDGPRLNADGTPAGIIIPEASQMLTGFTNEAKLIEILTTGKAQAELTVPIGQELAITTYMVFIGEDENHDYEGPTTLTTVFDVSQVFVVDSQYKEIAISVDTNKVLDNAKPFVDWYAVFADGVGAPRANTNIYLKHCKIGFEFSQEMFGANPDGMEKNMFKTDASGWINSIAIPGVDFQIRAGDQVVKACGTAPIAKTFPPAVSPAVPIIAFTGFKGATRFNNPGIMNDSGVTTAIFGGANTLEIMTVASDPDKDGLSTDIEMNSSLSNPFLKNYYVRPKFGSELAHFEGPVRDGSNIYYYYRIKSTDSCTSGPTISAYNPPTANTLTLNGLLYNDVADTDDGTTKKCVAYFMPLASNTTGYFYRYMIAIDPGSTDLTAPDGTSIPIIHYTPLLLAEGTTTQKITSPTMSIQYRSWETDTVITVSPTNLKPKLDDFVDETYVATVQAVDLEPGGIFFFGTEATCNPANQASNIWLRVEHQIPGIAEIHFNSHENYDRDVYLCHLKAANTDAGSSKMIGFLQFKADTTRTYGEVINQSSLGTGYKADSIIVQSPTRQIVCGETSNPYGSISVINSGVITNLDIATTNLYLTTIGTAIGFIDPNGIPVCAYLDNGNDRIIQVRINSDNTLSNYAVPFLNLTPAPTGTSARYAYRNGKLFITYIGTASYIEGQAFNVTTGASLASFVYTAITPSTMSIDNVMPIITSNGQFIIAHISAANTLKTYYYNGSTFINNDTESINYASPKLSYTVGDNNEYYILLSEFSSGSEIFEAVGLTAGSIIYTDNNLGDFNEQASLGFLTNKLSIVDANQALYYDQVVDNFVGIFPSQTNIFSFLTATANNRTMTYYGDSVYMAQSSTTDGTLTVTALHVK